MIENSIFLFCDLTWDHNKVDFKKLLSVVSWLFGLFPGSLAECVTLCWSFSWEPGWRDRCIMVQGSPGVHGSGPSQGEDGGGQACVNSCTLF